jgi:hypothetical protein
MAYVAYPLVRPCLTPLTPNPRMCVDNALLVCRNPKSIILYEIGMTMKLNTGISQQLDGM